MPVGAKSWPLAMIPSAILGSTMDGSAALAAAGLRAMTLGPKEGLALINGTDGMLGQLVLAHHVDQPPSSARSIEICAPATPRRVTAASHDRRTSLKMGATEI